MMMRQWSTSIRLVAATATVLAVAACSDAPLSTELQPLFNDAPTTPWKLHVCKIQDDGRTINFTASATAGTVLHPTFSIVAGVLGGPPSCKLVWEGTPGEAVTITITEEQSPFYELEEIRPLHTAGVTQDGYSVHVTDEYLAAIVPREGVITFKNRPLEAPPLEVSKTAAGRFEIPVRWELVKTVNPTSHTGTAGEIAGSSTWSVTATRIEGAPTNHLVTGTITVSNPAGGATQTFSVVDVVQGVPATVVCPTHTLAGGESTICTYEAAVAGATENTATVSSPGFPDVSASAAVSYTSHFTGDLSVTLADPRFSFSELISATTTVTFPESFPCPSDASEYTNGTHTRTETNTATLTGDETDLSRTATVDITCTITQGNGETATGQGFPWANTQGAPNNWFMYTPWSTTSGHRGISASASGSTPAGTNLIAGQHHIAGRITGVRSGGSTTITITLATGWEFDGVSSNVKINPMSCTTSQPYVQPGQFAVHRTAAVSASSITITGLPNTACYGIHVDVRGN